MCHNYMLRRVSVYITNKDLKQIPVKQRRLKLQIGVRFHELELLANLQILMKPLKSCSSNTGTTKFIVKYWSKQGGRKYQIRTTELNSNNTIPTILPSSMPTRMSFCTLWSAVPVHYVILYADWNGFWRFWSLLNAVSRNVIFSKCYLFVS